MKKNLIGTGYYKISKNTNGTKRLVVGLHSKRITQRTAAYISGDFKNNQELELERAQHAVGVKQLLPA